MKGRIACGMPLSTEPLLTIENIPAAVQYLPCPEDAATEHGVAPRLCACASCGLTQLDTEPASYYRDMIHFGGYSEAMDKLHRAQYDTWIPAFHLEGKKILEAGCGQDELLSIFVAYPVKVYGMEHFHELMVKAREKGSMVAEEYPKREDQVFEDGLFSALASFNFLEYRPDPVAYLHAIANNLTAGDADPVTVPSFKYILGENGFYELIPGRLSHFTEDSLSSFLNRCGPDVLEKECVDHDTISVWTKEKTGPDVLGLIEKQKDVMRDIIGLVSEVAARDKVTIWGAPHQGFSIAAPLGLGDKICCIINSMPFKQGYIIPSSHIPIISPDVVAANPAICILIAAPGYTEEIAARICEKFPAGIKIWMLRSDVPERLADKRKA